MKKRKMTMTLSERATRTTSSTINPKKIIFIDHRRWCQCIMVHNFYFEQFHLKFGFEFNYI
jgi:hypothetical protein